MNASAKARQCRNLSMDLEESAYNISQSAKKLDGYADLLEGVGACLRQNLQCTQACPNTHLSSQLLRWPDLSGTESAILNR